MNNKDREALDKFVDKDSLSPEDTKKFAEMSDGERATFIAERFFEAGAKHGRAELDELTSVLDLKKETIVEMQNAYETLNAHDEMLIATVDKLKEENKKLVEALKFYASQANWMGWHRDVDTIRSSDCEPAKAIEDDFDIRLGGKLARQVLKEIGEE